MTAVRPAPDILHTMRALPMAPLATVAPGTSLILAPHPDDETLGCGGLIAATSARGTPPVIVCVTDGAASHPGSASYPPARLKKLREDEMRAACAILGVEASRIHFLGLPDASCPREGAAFDAAVQRVAGLVREYGVTTLFATWPHDPHGDHASTAALALTCARIARTRLRFYPVWGWLLPDTCNLPDTDIHGARLDISDHLPAKRAAIAAHASQYGDLIDDSPDGFRLPPALLAVFEQPYEVFIEP